MSQQLEQIGHFRGNIINYGLNEAKSGAVGIYIEVAIDEIYEDDEWCDWREHDIHTIGDIWVVKKDGKINERSAKALMDHAGWDGDLKSIVDGSWQPTPVAVSVGKDTYKETTRYRIDWVNDYESTPGGGGNVTSQKAAEMQTMYGGQLPALAGNTSRNAEKPKGKPAAKPKGKPKVASKPEGNPDVPF